MTRCDFEHFYCCVIEKLANRFVDEHPDFKFNKVKDVLYEEYMSQKIMLRWIYEKKDEKNERTLLDRHKVCSCMTVAIIRIRPLTLKEGKYLKINSFPRINEQLAFMSSWELLKGFVKLNKGATDANYVLPSTYHNVSFIDTITRSLFFANQLNGLSTPLIANIFFLLEKYNEVVIDKY